MVPEGVLGVVVVKVEFEALEAEWSAAEPAFAADPGRGPGHLHPGLALLDPAPPAPGRAGRLRAEHRFGDAPFEVLKASATAAGHPPP
jgi:two-component system C4-dicarboxylate transport sensor histidine kinase DctB